MNEVSSLLERHGIRPTQQRVKVAEVLLTAPVHLTAEPLLTTLRQSPSRVSKATVYNTLKLFIEKGLVREVIVDPSKVFFDPNTSPHHHFYEVDTGKLSDIDAEHVQISGLPPLPAGMVTEGIDLIVRVRCKT